MRTKNIIQTRRTWKKMSNPRKAVPSLSFNGKNVTTKLKEYLESVSYTDAASGDSDSIDISLHNIGMKWMGAWYPKKGDKISGSITFQNWNAEGKSSETRLRKIRAGQHQVQRRTAEGNLRSTGRFRQANHSRAGSGRRHGRRSRSRRSRQKLPKGTS